MQKFELKEAVLQKYFGSVVPDSKGNSTRAENVRTRLTEIFNSSHAIIDTPAEGNLWGAYNAVTEYVQHEKTIPLYGKNSDEQRFDKVLLGDTALRGVAFDQALNLLKN